MSKKTKQLSKLLNQKTLTSGEAVRLLELDGWIPDKNSRQRGSHKYFVHPVKKGKITVPEHGGSPHKGYQRRYFNSSRLNGGLAAPHYSKEVLYMQDIYTYPAIFSYADDGISIKFPDLPGCLSCADDNSEAVFMAADALEGRLWSDYCDKIPFPEPSDTLKLKDTLKANQCITLIRIDMKKLRAKFSGKSANKMVTLPQWLLTEGKEAGINFSQILQEALMLKLGIKDTPKH